MQQAVAVHWARDGLKAKRSEEILCRGQQYDGSDAVGVWNVGRTFFEACLPITVNQLISAMAEICRDETEMVERKRARREGFS